MSAVPDSFAYDLAAFQSALTAAEVQDVMDNLKADEELNDSTVALRWSFGISPEDWTAIQLYTELDIAERQVAQNEAARVSRADHVVALALQEADG